MTKSVYIVGGAGVGKSTFTQALLDAHGGRLGPLSDLHSKANVKNVVTLRGHTVGDDGLYLGCMRDSFPGTDGLDRASSPVGAEWLRLGGLPEWILGEGATLSTRPFITALALHTDLRLVRLYAEEFIVDLRVQQRGSQQAPSFLQATATRAFNLCVDMKKIGVKVADVDTGQPESWEAGLQFCEEHLGF